jgi:hypothetical protein
MEGFDEEMSLLILASQHSVLRDAIARAAERGALSETLYFSGNSEALVSPVYWVNGRETFFILSICVHQRPALSFNQ